MLDSPARPPLDRRDFSVAAALALATFALYARTLGFDFVSFDDPQYVARNPAVRAGLTAESIRWAFGAVSFGTWNPLTWLSHMLAVELFGLAPAGHHALNAALHALNAALLFFALRAATGARWRSAVVAALFAFHPLHVESVAWISERKDVLSTAFGLLALTAYAAYARRPGVARYLGVAALFAASLASKPMLVTLPALLLLLDVWPLRRPLGSRLLLEKLPLLALSAACVAVAFVTQRETSVALLTISQRLANAVHSYVAYLEKAVWPVGLGMFYPHPYLPDTGGESPAAARIALEAALLLALTLAVLAARRRRYLAVGWLWYLTALLPVIGLVQVGRQGMADRYTYFPLIGIYLAAVWGGAEIVAALRRRVPAAGPAAAAAVLCLLAALAATTWRQTASWRDSLALYQRAMEVAPRNPTIGFNLGNELGRRGRADEAIAQYRLALEVAPRDADLHVNLANALRRRGEVWEAKQHYQAALAQSPHHALAHTNLGSLLRAEGNAERAERHYRHALRVAPRPGTAFNLANLLRERGALDEAIALYQQALAQEPGAAPVHNNLGIALELRGDLEEALRHYAAACGVVPPSESGCDNQRRLRAESETGSAGPTSRSGSPAR